jgi:hypothetical protein
MDEISESNAQPNPEAGKPPQDQPNPGQPTRRRGAQPGNHNALKHGLYSQEVWADVARQDGGHGSPDESHTNLEAEVAMLRSLIRRLFEGARLDDSPSALIEALRALGIASTRLAVLLRTQRLLDGGQQSQAMQIISEALAEVMAEIEQKTPPPGSAKAER